MRLFPAFGLDEKRNVPIAAAKLFTIEIFFIITSLNASFLLVNTKTPMAKEVAVVAVARRLNQVLHRTCQRAS